MHWQRFTGLLLLLGAALLLTGCPQAPPPASPEPEVKIPLSQDASINLNFVGLAGQPDNTEDFKSRFDSDEFKLFPLRFPVNNFELYTPRITAQDKMRFAFIAAWGELKSDLYGIEATAGEMPTTSIPLREYALDITPKLVKPDDGMYSIVIRHSDGTQLATLELKGQGDDAKLKAASGEYRVKQAFRDTRLRISGYEIWRKGDGRDDFPLLGVQIIADGWGGGLGASARPGWAAYKKVFPEVDLRILPADWFHLKNIPDSCMRLKADGLQQAGKRYGVDPYASAGCGVRCYSCGS